jgi:hypothetical protein
VLGDDRPGAVPALVHQHAPASLQRAQQGVAVAAGGPPHPFVEV